MHKWRMMRWCLVTDADSFLLHHRALSHDEAAEILKELNIFTSQREFEEIFSLLDVNDSGHAHHQLPILISSPSSSA